MCILTQYLQINTRIQSNTETALVVLKKVTMDYTTMRQYYNFRKPYIAIVVLLQARFSQLIFSPNRFGLLSLLRISEGRGVSERREEHCGATCNHQLGNMHGSLDGVVSTSRIKSDRASLAT